MYLNDIPSTLSTVLDNDPTLAEMFYALPVMAREKIANAGLYNAQEVGAYMESLILEGF